MSYQFHSRWCYLYSAGILSFVCLRYLFHACSASAALRSDTFRHACNEVICSTLIDASFHIYNYREYDRCCLDRRTTQFACEYLKSSCHPHNETTTTNSQKTATAKTYTTYSERWCRHVTSLFKYLRVFSFKLRALSIELRAQIQQIWFTRIIQIKSFIKILNRAISHNGTHDIV